jgi:hypothetical protein
MLGYEINEKEADRSCGKNGKEEKYIRGFSWEK